MTRLIVLLILIPLTCWAEPATVVRATELKQDPATDSPTVAALPENAAVEAIERKGGWTRVKAGSAEGWVRMLALRYGGAGPAKPGETGITQLFSVARTGTSGTQVTTGVRGLDADQLTNAQPNPAELAKMADFASDRDAAAGFAAKGELAAKQLEYPKP